MPSSHPFGEFCFITGIVAKELIIFVYVVGT